MKNNKFHLLSCLILFSFLGEYTSAQTVLFDFDNAPQMTSLPIDLTVNGVTAHFTATGQGFSIQNANVLGFTPQGFSGLVIYPNSIYQSDLLINFNKTITDFSILYSCQELGCDDAATMKVTAYLNGVFVGSNTATAANPGTWPTETLSCSFIQGFDSVVVHYQSPPPTCQDYGVIFMADNMTLTALSTSANFNSFNESITAFPNPAIDIIRINSPVNSFLQIVDLNGKAVYGTNLKAGINSIDISMLYSGIYNIKIITNDEIINSKMIRQ